MLNDGAPRLPFLSSSLARDSRADGALIVADVAPLLDEVCAFVLVAPCLGAPQTPLIGCGRDPASKAACSSKPKLALLGTHDQFTKLSRWDTWTATLRQPAEHRVLYGREVEAPCCGGAHTKTRVLSTHHVPSLG